MDKNENLFDKDIMEMNKPLSELNQEAWEFCSNIHEHTMGSNGCILFNWKEEGWR